MASVPGFLELFWCGCLYVCIYMCVCVFVCPPPRLLITSGVIWNSYDWLNKFYSCYTADIVFIDDGRGLRIEVRRINQPNKSKLSLYKSLLSL